MIVTSKRLVSKNDMTSHLVLSGFEHSAFMSVLEKGENNDEDGYLIDVKITINGVEVDVEKFCEQWDNRIDSYIKEEAEKLMFARFDDKMCEVENTISDIRDRLGDLVKNALRNELED